MGGAHPTNYPFQAGKRHPGEGRDPANESLPREARMQEQTSYNQEHLEIPNQVGNDVGGR